MSVGLGQLHHASPAGTSQSQSLQSACNGLPSSLACSAGFQGCCCHHFASPKRLLLVVPSALAPACLHGSSPGALTSWAEEHAAVQATCKPPGLELIGCACQRFPEACPEARPAGPEATRGHAVRLHGGQAWRLTFSTFCQGVRILCNNCQLPVERLHAWCSAADALRTAF